MKLFSWGANSYGQLGQGKISNECFSPEEIFSSELEINLQDVIGITGGGGHSFLIHNSGRLFGCGLNNAGQLGCNSDGNITKFKEIENTKDHHVIQISSKWDTSFALTKSQECLGWGGNTFGQLGISPSEVVSSRKPVTLIPYMVQQVEAGLRHCAIVTPEGYVLTSGDNRKYQLGRPITTSAHSFQPVPELSNVRMVACGQHHILALTADDKLYGWGCNKFGQLGVDPQLHSTVSKPMQIPVPRHSINSQTIIASGWTHSAMLTGDGTIINWGRNKYGQLGCAPEERQTDWKPEILKDVGKVIQLELGSEHTLALLDDGHLLSWGWNEHGSCGVGHGSDLTKPQTINLNSEVILVGTGAGHSFAIVN